MRGKRKLWGKFPELFSHIGTVCKAAAITDFRNGKISISRFFDKEFRMGRPQSAYGDSDRRTTMVSPILRILPWAGQSGAFRMNSMACR